MAAQRIFHWKHGWIPLDHYAAVEAANGRDSTAKLTAPPADALARAKKRQKDWAAAQQKIPVPSDVKSRQVGGFRVTTVDGYPNVRFKEVLELDKRPPEQYREVAKVASDVLRRYPGATVDPKYGDANPLQISFSNELTNDVMADTNIKDPNPIRLNPRMWDSPNAVMAQIVEMRANKWGIFAQASDLETFRRAVITHEIGHVLQMRDEKNNILNGESTLTAVSHGPIDKFTDEPVTPKQMGYHSTAAPGGLNTPLARWQLDSLNGRSAYATSDKYEFFAEAFLDGTMNGDQASESGKRAVALAMKVFAPGGAS